MTVCAVENASYSYLAKLLAKGDFGHIWDKSSNGTYDFLYLVSIFLKNVVDERLIDQGGVWNGSCGKGSFIAGLDYLFSEKELGCDWCSGNQINLLSGEDMVDQNVLRQTWCFISPGFSKLKLCLWKKIRKNCFDLMSLSCAIFTLKHL